MTQWAAFVGLTAILLTLLLALTRLTQQLVTAEFHRPDGRESVSPAGQPVNANASPGVADTSDGAPSDKVDSNADTPSGEADQREDTPSDEVVSNAANRRRRLPEPTSNRVQSLSTAEVFANVVLTQGLIAVVVLVGAWLFGVPAWALGLPVGGATGWPTTVLAGLGFGVGLWLASESATTLADAMGVGHGEQLRALLAPTTFGGWVVLLALALPTVAIGEELLFRAAAIGVPAAGFGTSPWALALVSSVAFAFCHGIQGRAGIVVTGVLGLVLAGAFVVTESLLLVIVAHYVLNATEFFVHEGLGVDPLADVS